MPLDTAPPLSLYLHFPWCVRKCPYCDFNSYTLHGDLQESRYVEALEHDLEVQARDVAGRPVISIFLGGGTPSLFSPQAIGRVLEAARRHLAVASDAEVTLEANPGTLERGRFADYRAAGINRVSLGAQSFAAERLEALGRIHSPEDTRRAAEELHAAGLENFNLDLMYALPAQEIGEAVRDVQEALSLRPAHLSHYQLTIEPGTVFAGAPPDLPDDDAAADMLAACTERLATAGFARYEVSGYARPGFQCRHNLNYWTFGDYLGVGAGAHGKLSLPGRAAIHRTVRPREPRRYIAAAQTAVSRTPVAARDLSFEFMLNGLRLVDGFELQTFESRTGLGYGHIEVALRELTEKGLASLVGGRCRPTPHGLRFLNDALLAFLPQRPETVGSPQLSTAR